MQLVKNCLDKQLIDHHQRRMGRIDGIVLEIGSGRPRVAWIEVGSVARARRLHPGISRLAAALARRFGAMPRNPWRLAFAHVTVAGIEALAAVDAEKTPASAWERWLRRIVRRIPGA
jgi:hypothetical protein